MIKLTKQEALIQKIEELKKLIEKEEEKKPTAEERFNEIFNDCVTRIYDYNPESTYLMKGCNTVFKFEKNILWCSSVNVWSIFEKEFNMSYKNIQNFIKIQVEKRFNCNGVTPRQTGDHPAGKMEKRFKQ